jgi:hypothetical protein
LLRTKRLTPARVANRNRPIRPDRRLMVRLRRRKGECRAARVSGSFCADVAACVVCGGARAGSVLSSGRKQRKANAETLRTQRIAEKAVDAAAKAGEFCLVKRLGYKGTALFERVW